MVALALVGIFFLAAATDPARQAADPGGAEQQALAATIDRALAEAWGSQQITPAPAADDAHWLRRLSLDLCGVVPPASEVDAFLADPSADKRARKIDAYIEDRRLADHFSFLWSNLLVATAGKDANKTKRWVRPWLREQLEHHVPFREITRHLVADIGAARNPGSFAFVLSYRDSIETLAGVTARAFLGLQIQCAQCHDHPYDTWKRDQFNQFAGFFLELRGDHGLLSELQGGAGFRVIDKTPEWDLGDRLRKLAAPPDRKMDSRSETMGAMDAVDGANERAMAPKRAERTPAELAALTELIALCKPGKDGSRPLALLESDPVRLAALSERLPRDALELLTRYRDRQALFGKAGYLDGTRYVDTTTPSRRAAVADWIVDPKNPWFGRAIVNRTWDHLFGKGLIDPVDDLSGSKDQVVPELLDQLGRLFVEHDSDLRFLLGALVRTKAYAAGNAVAGDPGARALAERWFAAHPRRPLTLEQLATSLLSFGVAPQPDGAADTASFDDQRELLLIDLARCSPPPCDGSEAGLRFNIPLSLLLMNGKSAAAPEALRNESAVAALFDDARPAAVRLTPLFHATVGRAPAEGEADRLLATLAPSKGRGTAAIDDLFWALINSAEFRTNQ